MTAALPILTNVAPDSLSLRLDDEEFHLPFERFPFFRDATAEQLRDVERPSPGHLRWPQLDVDLAVDSIRQPEAFPLVSRGQPVVEKPLALAAPKKIEFAPQDHIELYEDTARRFLRDVLKHDLDECYISDESYLTDFAGCGMPDELAAPTATLPEVYAIWDRWVLVELERRYGLVYESPSMPLVTLFRDIEAAERRREH